MGIEPRAAVSQTAWNSLLIKLKVFLGYFILNMHPYIIYSLSKVRWSETYFLLFFFFFPIIVVLEYLLVSQDDGQKCYLESQVVLNEE